LKNNIVLFLFFFSACALAQIEFPPVSPFSKIEQQVGITQIEVSYSRPAVKGRKIIGGLVPYNRIWRVGANESTKFKINTDISIGEKYLEKGTYALYAFPYESHWDVVFHRDTTLWGDGRDKYNPNNDALRVRVTPAKSKIFQENFLISFDSITHNGAIMKWLWEETQISIPIQVDTDKYIGEKIEKELQLNPTAQTYYEAARYLQEQYRDPETSLLYVNEAIELGGSTYYFFRVKSIAEASLGEYEQAIQSAQISRNLANKQGRDEFVRMNNENIKKWKKSLELKKD
jgi:hypothetical protein